MNKLKTPDRDFDASHCYASPSDVDVTAITKFKHADLWAAAKAMGSQAALARHLGVDQIELGRWINLRSVPPAHAVEGKSSKWSEEFLLEIEGKLLALTGKSWEELFPESLRANAEFLECSKTIERTASMSAIALENYAIASRERLLGEMESGEERQARADAITRVLENCDSRDAQVLRLRFGLDGEPAKTLDEVGEILRITRRRVTQIEARAIRRLQQPSVTDVLKEYA